MGLMGARGDRGFEGPMVSCTILLNIMLIYYSDPHVDTHFV